MLKLYIVRHGETEFNVQRRMQGRLDSPLTQRGVNNAIALGQEMKDIHFDKIFCSPSPRAYRTTELICGGKDISIQTEDDLREMNLAYWEGKSKEELELLYPEENKIFWNSPQLYKPEEGESFQDVQDRAVAFINKLASEQKDGQILIVTHSVVILTLATYFRKDTLENLWSPPLIHDTSVTLLTADEGKIRLEFVGDMSHVNQATTK